MEDRRRSAEIRRMASQKVAVEFVKVFVGPDTELDTAKNLFNGLVDWIDADVVSAGDRASGAAKPSPAPTPTQTPPNGKEAPREPAGPLSAKAQEMLITILEASDPELLKLKLVTMDLSQDTVEAVKSMDKKQAKEINDWAKEQRSVNS